MESKFSGAVGNSCYKHGASNLKITFTVNVHCNGSWWKQSEL